jgi:hypothetical protein
MAWGLSTLDKRRPTVLIVAAKWWPLSARIASALVRQGCRVSALCPQRHPLIHVAGLERIERYHGTRSLSSLTRALRDANPDVVIPCDDGVVAQLHALHAQEPALRPLIERSLGDPQGFSITANRYRLLEVAAELDILVPETRRVASTVDLAHWHEHVAPTAVLKVDGECGGNGVRICGSLNESLAAWRELTAPPNLATACKRLVIDHDPLSLWVYRNRKALDVTIQRLVRGSPANSMLACRNGELLSIVSVAVLATDGPTGAATVIRRIDNEAMERAAQRLASRLRLTGFYGLDFMIETGTGMPYLIEMNPRCTQLGHLRFGSAPSLAEAFIAALRGERASATGAPVPLDTVALFPQALSTIDAKSRCASGSYLDVPWEEPPLLAELTLDSWPERRWLSRLYHAMRPVAGSPCVEYGDPAPHTAHTAPKTGSTASIRLATSNR